jgi:osmoprotectant transport system permease protein
MILAQATSGSEGPGCPPAPTDYGTFRDALDFILHQRESVSGGICIGGPGELWDLMLTHLAVSFVAIAAAIIISVPIGLWLGHIAKGEFFAVSVSNVGRAVPSLALLAFFVAFLGLGFVNIAVVLMLLAIPPLLTNTYVGVRQVDPETVDAARGIGMTESQIIRKVEMPLALPTMFGGLRLSAVSVVATATIAPLGNVNTLGLPIITPQNYGLAGEIGAAIVVALITLAVGLTISAVERAVTPKGLKIAERRTIRGRFSLPTLRRMEANE